MAFPLSLRVSPCKEGEEADSLGEILRRIKEERGHFRNITEDSLRKEIENDAKFGTNDAPVVELEDVEDPDQRRKALYAAREEMLKYVRQAQNEALTALDFMSLLISRDAPRQADISMSPFLKQTIPAGTLGFDSTQASKPTQQQDDTVKTVAIGWNFQSLNHAADRLLDSATKLGTEMEKEARYWQDILAVHEKGWSLCRLPREPHTVAVRFGFSESAPLFNAQGLAALRPDNDGRPLFDQGLSADPRYVRVRLFRNNQTLATSTLPISTKYDQDLLETRIHHARDSLFEKELFHEMIREARSLLAYGVNVVDDQIHIPSRKETDHESAHVISAYKLVIDQASPSDAADESIDSGSEQIVNVIASSLRILLTNVYRRKFQLRSRPPSPLSNDKPSVPIHSIIRPVLCHFQHDDAVRILRSLSMGIIACLHSAGLEGSVTVEASLSSNLAKKSSTFTSMEMLVAALDGPLETSLTLHLPSMALYTLKVITHFAPPYYGTAFEVQITDSQEHQIQAKSVHFKELVEVYQHIIDNVCSAVARYIAQHDPSWVLEDSGTDLRKVVIATKRIRHITVGYHKQRLAVFSACEDEPPTILAIWTNDDTKHHIQLTKAIANVNALI